MKKRILRFPEVTGMLGVTRQCIYDMVARGDFPKPFKLTKQGRSVGWLESDINNWLETRVATTGSEE